MDLAVPFKLNNEQYTDIAKELNIKFNDSRNSKDKLFEFCEAYPNHTVNVEFVNNVDVTLMKTLSKACGNVVCRVKPEQIRSLKDLAKAGIPFFLDQYVTNQIEMQSLLAIGAVAIYPGGPLIYRLPDVQQWTKTRVILNAVATARQEHDPVRSMFFDPRGVDIYSSYIDIAEFNCGSPYDWNKFAVYYNTWFNKKIWRGNLQEIIPELEIPIPGSTYDSVDFVAYKLLCGRKCDIDPICRCHKCQIYLDLAWSMDQKNILVKNK